MVRHALLPDLIFDARLAVFLPETGSLVVADLHWGYAESHRATGNLFPAWGDDTLEATLRALVSDYAPRELVWLGDSLHTLRARARAEAFLAASPIPIHVIAGNHDHRWPRARPEPLRRGRFVLHHGDRSLAARTSVGTTDAALLAPGDIELVGHHHPAYVHRDGAGARLKLPALVQASARIILPAFSPWAAGVPWNDRLAPGETLWAAAPRRLLPITHARLFPAESMPPSSGNAMA